MIDYLENIFTDNQDFITTKRLLSFFFYIIDVLILAASQFIYVYSMAKC